MVSTVPTREQRRHTLGIDAIDHLIWKSWEPGKKYDRRVSIKNIEAHAQTICFKLPAHRTTFLTPFPEPITLRSGMSFILDVSFCPSQVVEIHDAIEVTVQDRGSFLIRLECRTPYAKMRCTPSSHDFQFCPINMTTTEKISMTNTGTVPLEFLWEFPAPFIMSPQHGFLQPNETIEASVGFTPIEACPVVGCGVCRLLGIDEVIAVIHVSGVGKYPFICFVEDAGTNLNDAGLPSGQRGKQDVARFQKISHSQGVVNFGTVLAGSVYRYELLLENPSPVPAHVVLRREDDMLDCRFELTPSGSEEGTSTSGSSSAECVFRIPRGKRQTVTVTYRVNACGSHCSHRNAFVLRTVAGNALYVETCGTVAGPRVHASTSYLNFGDVNLDDATANARDPVRVVQLENRSACVAYYEVMATSPGAAFSVDPSNGLIEAHKSVRLRVTFRPTTPINYLRRLFIAVQDVPESVFFVDVFGTAYNSQNRPPSFGYLEVDAFYLRMGRGLGLCTPSTLESLARTVLCDSLPRDNEAKRNVPISLTNAQLVWQSIQQQINLPAANRRTRAGRISVDAMLCFFHHSASCPFAVDAKQPVLQFVVSEKQHAKSVVVHNTSSEVAIATWCVPANCPLTVMPAQQDVPPGGSSSFQVALCTGSEDGIPARSRAGTPSMQAAAAAHGLFLECYVSYAQMRSFRLTREHSFIPPQCFTLPCLVRNPIALSQDIMPLQLDTRSVIFAPTHVGGTSFQFFPISNVTDVALCYDVRNFALRKVREKVVKDVIPVSFVPDGTTQRTGSDLESPAATASVFACGLPTGWIGPHQRALLIFCFRPTTQAQFEGEVTLTTTHCISDEKPFTAKLRLLGEADVPKLITTGACINADGNQLILRPTCVTGETRHVLLLCNPTSLSIAYRLVPSNEVVNVLRFEPANGILPGGQRCSLVACFNPQTVRRYEGTVKLLMHHVVEEVDQGEATARVGSARSSSENDHAKSVREYLLTWQVIGEGVHGKLELEPTVLELGEEGVSRTKEGQVTKASLMLYNSGMCALAYEVRVWTVLEPEVWGQGFHTPTLFNHAGILPARAHTTVFVTPHPPVGSATTEYILYAMLAGSLDLDRVASPTTLEEVLQHPHCRLTVRGRQPAVQVVDVRSLAQQRSLLWRQLGIDELNRQLAAPVHPRDVDEMCHTFCQYAADLAPVMMSLAVGPQHAMPVSISLLLENTSHFEVNFEIWLKTEANVSQESWFVEPEELRDIQHILDASLISIAPRHGIIQVGGVAIVTITYCFNEVGVQTLPIVLKISDGKRALMVLEGRTVPPDLECLSFHHNSSVYPLLPVALGDVQPPLQYIELENPLDRSVTYRIDVDAIEAFSEENYGFPIFQCIAPVGTLAPHSQVSVPWYFRPLEAKEYAMHIPVYTNGGESYTLSLVGKGYHPHTTPSPEVRKWIEQSFLPLPPALPVACATACPPSSRAVPVTLSTEVLSFTTVPHFALYRRCCTLTNHHPTDAYFFKWHPVQAYGDHILRIFPERGLIQPNGGRVVCRVAFYTGSTSQHLQWSVSCTIGNMTAANTALHESGEMATEDEQCIAVDGKGWLAHAAAMADQRPFERSTCLQWKKQQARVDVNESTDYTYRTARRQPVTTMPLEFMSMRALTEVAKTRIPHMAASALSDTPQQAVMHGALELLLQACIIPLENWERLYGKEALEGVYQPIRTAYMDYGPARAPVAVPIEGVQVTHNVLNELISAVVLEPLVQSAFMQPDMVREPRYYQDLLQEHIVADESTGSVKIHSGLPLQGKIRKSEEIAQHTGLLQSVLDRVFEELFFDVAESVIDEV